jgi:hypothetical protein
VQLALTGLDVHGHAIDEVWPYGEPPWPADRPALAKEPHNQRTPSAWHRLGVLDFDALGGVLAIGLAVIVTVRFVPQVWRERAGLIDAPVGLVVAGGHAVVAVGLVDEEGSECLVVKNSWGTWWARADTGS